MIFPTLILIHGAWHSPSCWERILPLIEVQGYKCVAPQMAYSAAYEDPSPAVESIEEDVQVIQSLIRAETSSGKDVVLLGHSLGGLPSCSALSDTSSTSGSGKVIGIIEIAALIVPTDTSPLSFVSDTVIKMQTGNPEDPWSIPDESKMWMDLIEDIPGIAKRFYADIPAEEGEKYTKELRKQSSGPMCSEKGVYSGWRDVPVWYLFCTEDRAIPLEWQKIMVQLATQAGAKITTREFKTSHSPFLSRPEETVAFIIDAVNDFGGR